MRILFLNPHSLDEVTGNSVTVERILRHVRRLGHEAEAAVVRDGAAREDVQVAIDRAKPDVVHWHHAYRTARWLPEVDAPPSVVMFTGTDLHSFAEDPAGRRAIDRAIRRARVLVTASASMRERARTLFGDMEVRLVPRGVEVGREPVSLPSGGSVVLLPGGIRPVKGTLFAVEEMRVVDADLWIAGPVLDEPYAARVRATAGPRTRFLDVVPHGAIGTLLARAEVVLNCSDAEALSNAVLEALVAGRAVLASDIPGNRDALPDGVGWLYRDRADFVAKVRRLLAGEAAALGRRAVEHAAARFSPEAEARALVEAYADAIRAG